MNAKISGGSLVELREEWKHPTRGITFHRGTKGKVVGAGKGAEMLEVAMKFPHGPPISAELPIRLLKRA